MDSPNKLSAHQARNAALLAQFKERNINLAEVRSVDLHFWAWGQPMAVNVGHALYKRGYVVLRLGQASVPDDPTRWNIEAGAKLSIQQVTDGTFVQEMIALAGGFGAEYDGWGTSL
jgi:hypothetical protein